MISGGHKILRPFQELRSEPAIRSNDTGQRTPYFDCCHLTMTWIFLRTLDFYNPGQKSLGQWNSICNFLSFLDILIKQCNLLKITCSSTSSPIISVWHESRYKPGLEVEDAKWLIRDAIAARIFNDQSGISLNLRTGPTGHATLFNQWEGALVFINKQIKISPQWSKIFKTTDGVGQNQSSFRGSQAYF